MRRYVNIKDMNRKEIESYLYKIRYYALFCLIFFLLSIYEGYFIAQNYPGEIQDLLKNIESFFEPARQLSSYELFLFIFENNAVKLFTVLLFSIFAGLSSLFAIFSNGFILGVVSKFIIEKMSLAYLLAGILPHGIFELTAFLLSAASGLRIGTTVLLRVFGRKVSVTREFSDGPKFYILVLVPLLLGAAFIEAYITPIVLSFFMP